MEGKKLHINEINFAGNEAVSDLRLKKGTEGH